MAILNITYQGQSADYELAIDFATTDADIRRIAVEVVRSGGVRGLHLPNLPHERVRVVRRRPPDGPGRRAADLPAPEGSVRRVAERDRHLRRRRARLDGVAVPAATSMPSCASSTSIASSRKNLAAQWFVKQSLGKNKAEAARLQLANFYGAKAEAMGVRLAPHNAAQLLAGCALAVDCFDNADSRIALSEAARAANVPLVHAALAADGTFGMVRWDERFTADREDAEGQATCEGGEHLPMIGLVGATLARDDPGLRDERRAPRLPDLAVGRHADRLIKRRASRGRRTPACSRRRDRSACETARPPRRRA